MQETIYEIHTINENRRKILTELLKLGFKPGIARLENAEIDDLMRHYHQYPYLVIHKDHKRIGGNDESMYRKIDIDFIKEELLKLPKPVPVKKVKDQFILDFIEKVKNYASPNTTYFSLEINSQGSHWEFRSTTSSDSASYRNLKGEWIPKP